MAKKKEVVITCNATNVKAVIEGLERGMAALAKEEEKLLNTIKQRGYAENDEKKRLKELEKAMDAMRTNVQKNRDEQKKLAEVMKDLSGAKLKDLKKALQEGKTALNNMSERDPKRKQLVDDLKRIEAQINKNTGATNKMTGAQKGFSSAIASTAKNLATYMIGFAGFNKVKSLVEDVFRSNLKLSDSLANIRKVSGLSGEAINELYRNISKIDSRNTIETLNNLAYTGAKLGIGQNYGVEGLTGFVKAAEQVQMALGEDMGEKALPDLSKMVEVMGLIPKYGVEQSMQKAASAIFQLGATSTATGTNIVEFSKRLYGLANVSRISTQDLLALGSASDAMGLMPEVSATAFNKLFTSIQRQHNLIEQSLGMTKGTIKQYYDEGKTMDAIVEIFERMNQKGNLNLLGNIFKDLGSDGARLVNVMATMADRADILRKHLETSRDAFKEGEAVIGEYMIQNQTAAALVERASNLWAKAFVNPEGVDMVKEMAQAWYDLSKQMTQSEALMSSLHTSIGMIANAISILIKMFPVLIRFGIIFATTFGLKGLIAGIGGLVTAFRTLYTDIALATGAMGKFNVMMKSNAILFAISSLITAITLFNDYSKAAEEAAKREAERQAKLKAAFEESKEAVQKVVKPLEVYKKALDDASLSEKQRMALVKQFKNDYQDYLDYLGLEINSAVDLARAYAQVVRVMKQKKAYEERESYRQQQNGDNRMSRIENQAKVEGAARSFGLTDVDKKWLEQNQWKGTNQLYRELVEKRMGAKAVRQDGSDVTFIYIDDKLVNAGTQFGPRAKKRYKKMGSDELYESIDAYIASFRTERDTNKQIDKMFNTEYKDIDLENFNIDEFNDRVQRARWKRKGSLDNEKPDKAAQRAARQAENAEKKRMRDEMEEAEKDSTAVINAIEEFYRLQESAMEQLVADGKITREEADRALNYIKNQKDTMLMNARRAIAGKDSKFEELRKTMGQDMLRPDDVNSQRAMNTVQTIDVAKAAQRLQKFDGSKAVYDLNAGSFTQAMLKNAAQNELNIQRRQAAVQTEIDKLLLQYQYVEQAQRDFGDKLVKMGLITDGYQKVVQQLADGTEIVANTNEVQGFANKVVGLGSSLYAVNPESTDQLKQLMQSVMTTNGKDKESFASIFPNYDEWMKQPEQYKEQMQAMYELMIQYEGIYYDKLKQRDDLQNKRLGSWWDHSDQKKENDQKLRNIQLYDFQYNTMHEGETMGFMMGLTNDLTHDPEVMREQAILEAKIAIWQKAKEEREANLISEEVYQQKLRDMQDQTMAYSQKVMENINKRIDRLHKFEKPVIDMAGNVGKKLGEMIAGAEKDSMTWSEIWKSMALAVAESVIDMGAQYAQNLIMEKSMNAQSKNEALSKATVDVAAGTASGAAKTIGTLGWWGIALIPVIVALLKGLLQSAFSSSNENASASTASNVNRKLVSGMLTYDKGNVQRFIGQDGKVYTATEEPAPKDGLVTQPIATTVQGQPALVAERGPEIVIGRETTRAIMMNEPQLIKYLADYGKTGGFAGGWRPFDTGNVTSPVLGGSAADNDNTEMQKAMSEMREVMTGVLYYLQHPVRPKIDMWSRGGEDGLYDSIQKADKFMSKYKP